MTRKAKVEPSSPEGKHDWDAEERKPTYRCTLPHLYGPGTPGYDRPGDRNGIYERAYSPEECVRAIVRREMAHPWGKIHSLPILIDVQAWDDVPGGSEGEYLPQGRYIGRYQAGGTVSDLLIEAIKGRAPKR